MSATSSATTILIVEDDRFNVRLVGEICKNAGYAVRVAMDGIAALEEIAREKPDLVLLDLMIPHLDGFEVLERIRGRPETADIPVILVTAVQDVEARNRGIELGADDFISKPFKLFELQNRVKSALQLRQFRRQLVRDLTPPAGRARPKALLEESAAADAALASLKVGGGPAQVLTVEVVGSGPVADVVEAVLDAARQQVPGGKSNLFGRGGRRHTFVVAGDEARARAIGQALEAVAARVRSQQGAREPVLYWGVGPDRGAADEACEAARAAGRASESDL